MRRTEEEKGRRDFYQIEADFSKVLRGGLVPLAASKLASAGQMLEGMLGALPDLQPAGRGGVRQRLQEAKELQEKLSLVLQSGLLSRFLQ